MSAMSALTALRWLQQHPQPLARALDQGAAAGIGAGLSSWRVFPLRVTARRSQAGDQRVQVTFVVLL